MTVKYTDEDQCRSNGPIYVVLAAKSELYSGVENATERPILLYPVCIWQSLPGPFAVQCWHCCVGESLMGVSVVNTMFALRRRNLEAGNKNIRGCGGDIEEVYGMRMSSTVVNCITGTRGWSEKLSKL